MSAADDPEDYDAIATLADAIAHPIRVAILNVLRKEKRISLADLRRAASAAYVEFDTRNAQFHLYKMQAAGVVKVEREGGRDFVHLVRDVTLRVREFRGVN